MQALQVLLSGIFGLEPGISQNCWSGMCLANPRRAHFVKLASTCQLMSSERILNELGDSLDNQ
eukprot:12399174-Karenia_brevis.AAC.1